MSSSDFKRAVFSAVAMSQVLLATSSSAALHERQQTAAVKDDALAQTSITGLYARLHDAGQPSF
jgi:hypothetical protein